MTKAVVFFDLDGTLMRDDKTVAPDSLAALAALRAKGNLPVIATGRAGRATGGHWHQHSRGG